MLFRKFKIDKSEVQRVMEELCRWQKYTVLMPAKDGDGGPHAKPYVPRQRYCCGRDHGQEDILLGRDSGRLEWRE